MTRTALTLLALLMAAPVAAAEPPEFDLPQRERPVARERIIERRSTVIEEQPTIIRRRPIIIEQEEPLFVGRPTPYGPPHGAVYDRYGAYRGRVWQDGTYFDGGPSAGPGSCQSCDYTVRREERRVIREYYR